MPNQPTVLIVDDDPVVVAIHSAYLSAVCNVHTAADISSAREEIKCHPPDVVLLDIQLPDGDGFALCRELTQIRDRKPPRVVMLSGTSPDEDSEAAKQCGASDFLTKPVNPQTLRALVFSS
jgi:DNA-binding response OmpR family regulator